MLIRDVNELNDGIEEVCGFFRSVDVCVCVVITDANELHDDFGMNIPCSFVCVCVCEYVYVILRKE